MVLHERSVPSCLRRADAHRASASASERAPCSEPAPCSEGRGAVAASPRSGAAKALVALAGLGAALLGTAGEAAAQKLAPKPTIGASVVRGGKHCLDEQQNKLMLNHYTAGSINPLGIETQLRLSFCTPLIEKPGLLFDFSKLDAGLVMFISPTHVHVGPSLTVAPLSFLVFRAELTGFYIWPIPLQGAGFNRVQAEKTSPQQRGCFLDKDQPTPEQLKAMGDPRYDPNDPYQKTPIANPGQLYCDYDPSQGQTPINAFHDDLLNRPANGLRAGQSTYGVRALLGVTLQGAIPLGKKADLLFADGLSTEFWRVAPGGDEGYYYLARRDVMMRTSGDWVIANTAALLVSIKVRPNVALRIGATDDLVYTPNFGYLGNVAAGLLSISVPNLRGLAKQFAFFLRVGGFTNHAFRGKETAPWTIAGGFDITYEIWKRSTKKMQSLEDADAAANAPGSSVNAPDQVPTSTPSPAAGEPAGSAADPSQPPPPSAPSGS